MKRTASFIASLLVLLSVPGWGAALGTAASSVIPSEVQQIITVDYRQLAESPTALALKAKVLPDNLKDLETALRGVGVNPDKDVDSLTFASFRNADKSLRIVGIAQGEFSRATVIKRMRARKIKPTKYHTSFLYPMSGGMEVTFLDEYTMLFGDHTAIAASLDARDGNRQSLASNSQISDLVRSADAGAVWSVLDSLGTQTMMRSTLGDAARLADYDLVKKRLLGSVYTMDFTHGVKFDLNVLTADSMTAATLSSLLRAGMMFKKMNASGVEKIALDNVTVDNDSDHLLVHFKSDDEKFQSLLQSPLFTSIA
ncbi:MAG TPA: hypothetical protein VE734_03460, partial [Terriglobales bacterium]|nr:hypothetical protein [Terriglobales bacterium]